ncbi:zinc carboxypeptidase domain-containing protein [Phthorimaea operculella]|nr:zinc carboxypeptidase domain-containing protein [Phthorimaea operculella]
MNETHTEILVAPDLVQVVDRVANENELLTHIVIDDFEKIREECVSAGSFSWTSYYDVAGIHGYLRNMSRMYPKWAKVVSAGKSYEARDMLGLRIKTRTPGVTQKPIIFIESGIHAREWITPATTTYFINQLLTSTDPAIQAMREQFEWHIFPTVNPDGYQYSCDYNRLWRKTRSKSSNGCYGTDPNRNWDYNWMTAGTSNDPCDDQYGGTKPFSEAETTNLKNYLSHFNPAHLKAYIAFHSDAQRLLLPYSDTAKHLDNYDDMVKIGKVSKIYGYKVNKAIYLGPGTAKEILSYYNVADIHEYLRNMSNIYPEWVKVVSAGKSYEGRELLGIQIKTPGTNNKPIMFIESGIHASERIGPATTTYFINQLLTSTDPEIQAMRKKFEWHIFPTVNPDGYQYACDYDIGWRKTRSKSSNGCYGTDPNRNWDYNWMKSGASDDPCSDHYSGTEPFSEEETKNLARYVSGLKNLTSYIAFHSDAQMILIPYSDTKKHEDNYNDMARTYTYLFKCIYNLFTITS